MEQPYFPPSPQAFTRIEMRQFGARRASRQLAPYIDLPVHPLISPRIITLILLDPVHRQLGKSLQIHSSFPQTATCGTKDRFLYFKPRPVLRCSSARAAYGRSPTKTPCSSES